MVARRSIRTEGWFERTFEQAPPSVATDANDDPCSRNTEKNMCVSSRLDSECTQAMVGVGTAICQREAADARPCQYRLPTGNTFDEALPN